MYLLWNVPIEAPGQMLAFRDVERGDKVIVPSLEGKRAGDGSGNQNGDNRGDGMEMAQLAVMALT